MYLCHCEPHQKNQNFFERWWQILACPNMDFGDMVVAYKFSSSSKQLNRLRSKGTSLFVRFLSEVSPAVRAIFVLSSTKTTVIVIVCLLINSSPNFNVNPKKATFQKQPPHCLMDTRNIQQHSSRSAFF